VLLKTYQLSKGNPIQDMKEMLAKLKGQILARDWSVHVKGFGVTGYAGPVLEQALKADAHVVETVAHMMSAVHYFGDVDVICDIGGQDIKVKVLDVDARGRIKLSMKEVSEAEGGLPSKAPAQDSESAAE